MATWNPDNVVLTNKGNEVLSKVQAGVGGLTVTRIVTGGTIIPYSQLYRCEDIPDIKQVCTILAKTTDRKGSEISVSVNNKDLEEEYALYTLGIYVTHPDFAGEILYLVAECDIEKPDLIPHPSVTIATMYYSLYMEHSNTDDITIIVNADGSLPLTGGQIDGDLTVIGKLKTSTEPVDPDDVVNKQALDLAMQGISSDSVVEQNKQLPQKFWRGTKAEYDAIENKDESVLYIVIDEQSGACPYYTKEEIDARLSGDNLALNPRFKVNQRGENSYTASDSPIYTVDGWVLGGQHSLQILSDGVRIKPLANLTSNVQGFYQKFESKPFVGHSTGIMSILFRSHISTGVNCNIRARDSEGNLLAGTIIPNTDGAVDLLTLPIDSENAQWFYPVNFTSYNEDDYVDILGVKIETGSIQTLASKTATGEWQFNDPAPNYAIELAKCQRYQLNLITGKENNSPINTGLGVAHSNTNITFEIAVPTTLRVNPTVTFGGNIYVTTLGGKKFKVLSIAPNHYNVHVVSIKVTCAETAIDGSSLPENSIVGLWTGAPDTGDKNYLLFDANL